MAREELPGVSLLRENSTPSLRLTFKDLMDLCLIIRGSIHSLLETSQPGLAQQKQLRALIQLYRRLMSVPSFVTGIAILLSQEEINLLDAAVVSFCAYVRDSIPPSSAGHEEILRDFERIHETLHML